MLAASVHLFDNKVATQWRGVSRGATRGHKLFMGRNPLSIDQREPGNSPTELINSAAIHFYLKNDPQDDVSIAISDISGEETFEETIDATAGINRYFWPMRFSQGVGDASSGGRGSLRGIRSSDVAPGTYLVRLVVDGEIHTTTISIRADPESMGIR